LRHTLRDSYATVVFPVAQGPKRPFRGRSASWGIPKSNVGSGHTSVSDRLKKRHHSANYVPGWGFEDVNYIKVD